MPKKPSTVLVMKDYQPLSSRRWYTLTVQGVMLAGRGAVCLELAVIDAPEQAGRRIVHRMPAVLAPNSPLCRFLAEGFGIQLAENEPLDLATLAGRAFRARFTKLGDAGVQNIAAVQPSDTVGDRSSPTVDARRQQEDSRGLG